MQLKQGTNPLTAIDIEIFELEQPGKTEEDARREWIIEEGVIDPEMPMPEEIAGLEDFTKLLAKAKRQSRHPAPKHCEINYIPENITKYITDLLPSIKVVVANSAYLPFRHADVDLITNTLVVYLLDNDRYGTPRWRLYDVNRHPRPMYHQYVLKIAYYAAKDYLSKMGKFAKEVGIQTSERPDGDFATDPGYIHHSQLNRLRPDLEPDTPDLGLTNSEFALAVEHARAHLEELQRTYSKINPLSWQVYALDIVDRYMAGETLAEIKMTIGATGISRTSMNKWWDSIRKEIIEYLDENPFR